MPRIDPVTGQIYYHAGDGNIIEDVLYNGVSALKLQIIEVMVYPATGFGYIMCRRELDKPDQAPEKLIDGQYLTHTYHGQIEVVFK